MMDNNNDCTSEEQLLADRLESIRDGIYQACLPTYLQKSWDSGRGQWYEEVLREQLDTLVISEVYDSERLDELERQQDRVALIFGILGASFRILDHVGMHLRGQTFGQYELLSDDETLLCQLCQRFLQTEELHLSPYY